MVQEGQTFLWPGMSDNSEVEIVDVGEGEPEKGAFGDPMGDGRVKLDSRPPGLKDEMMPGRVVQTEDLRQEIDPREIQRRRSDAARQADRVKDAEITTDTLEWASDPSQHDFPGVDTGPKFRDEQGDDFDTQGFLDSLF